mgnify:CR=1 FL=1
MTGSGGGFGRSPSNAPGRACVQRHMTDQKVAPLGEDAFTTRTAHGEAAASARHARPAAEAPPTGPSVTAPPSSAPLSPAPATPAPASSTPPATGNRRRPPDGTPVSATNPPASSAAPRATPAGICRPWGPNAATCAAPRPPIRTPRLSTPRLWTPRLWTPQRPPTWQRRLRVSPHRATAPRGADRRGRVPSLRHVRTSRTAALGRFSLGAPLPRQRRRVQKGGAAVTRTRPRPVQPDRPGRLGRGDGRPAPLHGGASRRFPGLRAQRVRCRTPGRRRTRRGRAAGGRRPGGTGRGPASGRDGLAGGRRAAPGWRGGPSPVQPAGAFHRKSSHITGRTPPGTLLSCYADPVVLSKPRRSAP